MLPRPADPTSPIPRSPRPRTPTLPANIKGTLVRIRRSASLAILALVAVPWAAALVVGGLWILQVGGPRLGLGDLQRIAAGASAIAAGSLVFTYCVADRLFPLASRGLVWAAEILSCLTLLLGLGVLAAHWAWQVTPPAP